MNSGKLLNGLISTRNAIETCIIVPFLIMLEVTFLPMRGYTKLMTIIITVLPVLIITAMGIAGDSFTQRLAIIMKYYRRRRKLHFRR